MIGFLIIGGVGFFMLVLTWFMGEIFDLGHDIAGLLGGDHDFHLDSDGVHDGPSPFSSRVIFTFMTAFGGGGAVGRAYDLPLLASTAIGFAAGLAIGGATWGIARVLFRQQASSAVEVSGLVGRAGRVAVGIPRGGVGQVVVMAGGGSSTFLARSRHGGALAEGSPVNIVEVQGDTLVVEEPGGSAENRP